MVMKREYCISVVSLHYIYLTELFSSSQYTTFDRNGLAVFRELATEPLYYLASF